MTTWVDLLKNAIPDYAKDTKLNLDAVIKRSSLKEDETQYVALAAVAATGNKDLTNWLCGTLSAHNLAEANAAMTAASIMAQNNVWYPYVEMTGDPSLKGLPAQLRMNAIVSHGGTTKARFESYSLAASIIGKCHFCVVAHYEALKKEGYSVEQLRDIGRIAAVMVSACRVATVPSI
jgi:alkyl hydroperoxide reductase subunit D